LDRVSIEIATDSGLRASEIISDLRAVAETLYYPMSVVGFWDYSMDMHLCPQEERRQPCPHKLDASDPRFEDYRATLQRGRQANLELHFSHANITMYLS
jgi:hypothetical protein